MRRPSIGTRILKSLARFFAAVLIGIGLTLAWQSYGEQAKQFTTTLAPSLAWLLPAENVKTAPEVATSSDLMQQMKLIRRRCRDRAAQSGATRRRSRAVRRQARSNESQYYVAAGG
jgi:hypothetical protein